VPVSASLNTYAAWDNGSATYATLEAAPTYGVLEGGRLSITRTLPSSATLLPGHAWAMTFGGTLVPSGNPTKQATHKLVGALASSGIVLIGKIFTRSLGGSLSSNGTLARVRNLVKALAGTLAPTATLSTRIANRTYVTYQGRVWLLGELRLALHKGLWPPLVHETPQAFPLLVSTGASSAPPLTPTAEPTWPPLNPADRVS